MGKPPWDKFLHTNVTLIHIHTIKKPGNAKKKITWIIIKENHITSNKDDSDFKYCINCNLL